jgi:hypothetical protein
VKQEVPPDFFEFLSNDRVFRIVLFFLAFGLVALAISFFLLQSNLDAWVKLNCPFPPFFAPNVSNNSFINNITINYSRPFHSNIT